MSLDLVSMTDQIETGPTGLSMECAWCPLIADQPAVKKMHDMLWHGTPQERKQAQTTPWNVSGRSKKEIVLETETHILKYWIIG